MFKVNLLNLLLKSVLIALGPILAETWASRGKARAELEKGVMQ
jgi:hypothetical protein